MASKFDQKGFVEFKTNYSVKNGELSTAQTINHSPERLKKELNNIYNVVQILNGERCLDWNPVEDYLVGELVQNRSNDDKIYRSKKINTNKRPDLYPDLWEIAKNTDYTEIGDFNNYLAKDNITPYSPTDLYHPATKRYVDYNDSLKLNIDGKAVDSAKLNGEVVGNVLTDSLTQPASVKLVKLVDDKANTKLPAVDFNAQNIINMLKTVDGSLSGLDADLLDGLTSEEFMRVYTSTNLDTALLPGTFYVAPGTTGAPDMTSTFVVNVMGNGNFKSQIATSVSENKLYYRSYVGAWSTWKEFASASGNVATADKLSSPVTISVSGDLTGSASFDGSQNISISTTVHDDSHTHDGRYYTEAESDNRFLGITTKAVDSELLDGVDSTQFVRSDQDDTMNGNYTVSSNFTVNGDLIVNGTTTTINSNEISVDDKNIELGSVNLPTDTTANGGGIILKGSTDKTILWSSTDNLWHVNPGIQTSITGNATSATKLATARTISISGDATGSALFDGTANSNIVLTIADDSHNHVISNVDGLQTALDNKLGLTGKAADSDKLDGYNSSVLAVPNTAVIRDGLGNISGTSSSAQYADLAEIYTSKENYSVGMLVSFSESDDYDVEVNDDLEPFGIVSQKPGFLLDEGINGIPIALIGKTPVLVKGKIKKGDKISPYNNGICYKSKENVIGTALESNDSDGIKLVKCFVRTL